MNIQLPAAARHAVLAHHIRPVSRSRQQISRQLSYLAIASKSKNNTKRQALLASPYVQPQRPLTANLRHRHQVGRFATASSLPPETYEAVVVGAGPAGVSAVGSLLENGIEPVMWVDHDFNGGRVNKYYREVPSNTKTKLFIDYATSLEPFRNIVKQSPPKSQLDSAQSSSDGAVDMLKDMRELDQEKGCSLGHAADMTLMLTRGLKSNPSVKTVAGNVTDATFDEQGRKWRVQIQEDSSASKYDGISTKRLVLCTGSAPLDPPLPVDYPIEHLDLDDALSPTRLQKMLSSRQDVTIAVIGASHSAILVLMNLAHLASSSMPSLKVKWFTRHPLRYAEYFDSFIARDNTGLKGEAAVWARENLEPEKLAQSPVGRCIEKISYEKGHEADVYAEHLPGCQYVIQAIGYKRNALPHMRIASDGHEFVPQFDHDNGVFQYEKSGGLSKLPGLYGAGIAFPERVTDKKYGHQEFNVGFAKFMKAINKWIPEWKAA